MADDTLAACGNCQHYVPEPHRLVGACGLLTRLVASVMRRDAGERPKIYVSPAMGCARFEQGSSAGGPPP